MWGYNEEVEGQLINQILEFDTKNGTNSNEQVSNRVSGLSLRCTFNDHRDIVTAIQCIGRDSQQWMVFYFLLNVVNYWMGQKNLYL